jgi:magnesium chelatase subunit H
MRFVFLTMDGTHSAALREAATHLHHTHGITLQLGLYHATSLRSQEDWHALEQDAATADFIFGARLFGEDYVRPLGQVMSRVNCPVCIITSNPSLIHHTQLGKFSLQQGDEEASNGRPTLLQQLGKKFKPGSGAGEIRRQLAVLRNLSKVLKHIPGKARDLYTYIAVHQYWLHSSPENLYRMLCMLIERYVPGYKGKLPVQDPIIYPDVAIFHPDAQAPFTDLASFEKWQKERQKGVRKNARNASGMPRLDQGCVGILSLRTVALSGNTAHLDALVRALEQRGIEVRMAYSSGLDFRPTINQFYRKTSSKRKRSNGQAGIHADPDAITDIDLLINGTGFSLVGGPAESRPDDAQAILSSLNVSYLDLFPLAFQRVEEWQSDDSGLIPIHLTMNVAIPELDGATEPMVIGGPTAGSDSFVALQEQVDIMAQRIARRVALRRKRNAEKKVALTIFSFPPNMGNIGTAAYLNVFESLYTLLQRLKADGYSVDLPEDVEDLRQLVTTGNAHIHGTDGNVAAYLPVNDYLRLFPFARDIEQIWGRAPGELLNDGSRFFILGRQLGNVFIGIQPGFGYERDPMRLLMAKDASPHHGFAAFYTWLEHVFQADAIVHFGTHGALEFMPGKQAGLSTRCWPVRLLGGLPNVYYYSVNNPSEGTIAKRRSSATLVSYMVPPLQQAGLYKGLRLLKDNLDRYRQQPSPELLEDIRMQADRLDIVVEAPAGDGDDEPYVAALAHELLQVEQRMIPMGLHTLGKAPSVSELTDILALVTAFNSPNPNLPPLPQLVALGLGWNYEELRSQLKRDRTAQERWEQIDTICHEAIRRFIEERGVGGAQNGKRNGTGTPFGSRHGAVARSTTQADTYLHQQANILPGKLRELWVFLDDLLERIVHDQEVEGLLQALRGSYILPSPGNDVVRNPAVVPTGRNIYGLDPYRVPSGVAQEQGTRLVAEMLERLTAEQGALPETVAIVLWGIDNLKSDGEGIAQVLALLGARVVLDELGKATNVALIPLAELGRPRVDVVVTVSGIFRDLLHHQMVLLDKAARMAAAAEDEPLEANFVRKHALQQAAELGISLDEASTRIFANAPGSYGANVNHMVESGTWEDDSQLSDAFLTRKSFSFNANGQWSDCRTVMESALSTVDATFQNIDSFEVGISDIDYYYESLGGISKSVEVLRGKRPPVMVADAVSTSGRLSSLEQMVRLESRAKLLNPKWFEAMLSHGTEGVREIEARVNSTYGWSATTSSVEDWVYQGVADTYLLDEEMRNRLAQLNPNAAAAMTRRLLEANARGFWDADDATLEELRHIYDDLEDRLEGM